MTFISRYVAGTLAALAVSAQMAVATADRAEVVDFLETTGFDVALESIKLSAESAPLMLGLDKEDFGSDWTGLTEDVFDTRKMHAFAVEMLTETLDPELLAHATQFYASDLGQRIVSAENASHMKLDSDVKAEAGEAIVAGLVRHGSGRLEDLRRMTLAIDTAGVALRAMQEVQVRFLLAAAGAGVIDLRLDEPDLRAMLAANSGEVRRSILTSALSGAAYTYQAFSDEEVAAYAEALEHPKMQAVYELMNLVQFEIMADRFEALAVRMGTLAPSEEL